MSRVKKTKEEYISQANIIHKNLYDYSIFEYNGSKEKGSIICKTHGLFEQRADLHLLNSGCPKCSYNSVKTKEEVLEKFNETHNFKYDYSKFVYKNIKTKSFIICKIHGDFLQNYENHSKGKGCPKCGTIKSSKTRSKDKEIFIKQSNIVHNNFYNYEKSDYINWRTNVKIECPKHGYFLQSPHNHIKGHGCHKCSKGCRISKGENEVFEFVKSIIEVGVLQNDREKIKPKELDIYIPELNLAIEFNGFYWHSLKIKPENHREVKTKLCNDVGLELLHVEEMDWKNNKNMVKNKIKRLINKHKNDAK